MFYDPTYICDRCKFEPMHTGTHGFHGFTYSAYWANEGYAYLDGVLMQQGSLGLELW